MKKILIILWVIPFVFSCLSVKNLKHKKFIYKSKNRELSLTFSGDSMCVIKNTFFCNKIDDKFREIKINATYKKQGNKIIIKNINCKNNNCIYPPTMEIPIQENSDCLFLNNEGRKSKIIFDGRTYQSNYYKYGLVPNIDIDTMYIVKRKIIFVKKIKNGSFGFIFK